MRYLVIALVAANLAFYFLYPRSPSNSVEEPYYPPLPQAVQRLVLLSESPPPAPVIVEDDGLAAGVQDATGVEEAVLSGDTGEAPAVAGDDLELPEAKDDPEPENEASGSAVTVVEEAIPEPPPEPVCHTIGPFLAAKEATAVAVRLEDNGYEVSQRSDKIRQPAGYWVYLPAMPADEARRIVSDLKVHGIKDYFVGKKNYISLGIFSRKSQARSRQKQLAGLGYDTVLDRRYRNRWVRWLDIRDAEHSFVESELWGATRKKYPDAGLQESGCE